MVDVLYGIAAALCGMGVSYLNYRLTERLLDGGNGSLMKLSLRAVITALFIGLLFLAGSQLHLPMEALLIGGAAGLTLGLVFFTAKLMRAEREKGREDRSNG